MHTRTDIGAILIARRRGLGVTQSELGMRLGVLQPQIARWEADSYASASLKRVEAVAAALGVDIVVSTPLMAAENNATYATGSTSILDRTGVNPVVIAAFCRSHGITRLEAFGSVLHDSFSASSDVDLLATYAPGRQPSLFDLEDHQLELSAMLRRRVDLHTRRSVERGNPVVSDRILSEARVVYEA